MRWSLILYSLIAVQSALSFVCVALAIPSQWDELERREPKRRRQSGPRPEDEWKLSSKEYRENAKEHPHAYHVKDLGPKGKMTEKTTVSKTKLQTSSERSDHAKKMLNDHHKKHSPIHAGMLLLPVRLQFLLASCALIIDHVFEVQMLVDHLKQHGVQSVFTLIFLQHFLIIFLFSDLKPGSAIHDKVKHILNGKENMALIPGSINQSVRFLSCQCWQIYCMRFTLFQKGQLIKHGMQGKETKRQEARDDYAVHSYHTAHETAKKLDEALKHVSLCNSD